VGAEVGCGVGGDVGKCVGGKVGNFDGGFCLVGTCVGFIVGTYVGAGGVVGEGVASVHTHLRSVVQSAPSAVLKNTLGPAELLTL
jgi:hypothetical protein